jgi:hypothetical protein
MLHVNATSFIVLRAMKKPKTTKDVVVLQLCAKAGYKIRGFVRCEVLRGGGAVVHADDITRSEAAVDRLRVREDIRSATCEFFEGNESARTFAVAVRDDGSIRLKPVAL